MRSLFRPPPTPPSPPDIATILKDVQQIIGDDKNLLGIVELFSVQLSKQITALGTQLTAAVAHFDARLDQIEAEINPVLAPTALQFWSFTAMAFVTSISPTDAAVTELSVADENGVNLPVSQITWAGPRGEASASDMKSLAVPDADGVGFDFQGSGTEPTETFTVVATWTDPAGVALSVSATLTVNLTAAVAPPPPAPTALQFNLISGT
jgi:hypothetical protein